MITLNTLENCCGVVEIGHFPYNTHLPNEEQLRKEIKEELIDYCIDEALNKEENKYYNFFIATTQKNGQVLAGKILNELGFKGRVFKDSFGNRDLIFWTRRGLPRDLKKEVTKQFNKRKKDYDRW